MSLTAQLATLLMRSGLPDPLASDPMPLLQQWLDHATASGKTPNPNAIALASLGADGRPSCRIVLCKRLEQSPPALVFYTNYLSRKGRELTADPRAAATFHWDHDERQARAEGTVSRTSEIDSDEYFRTRPLLSRLGAWASRQSQPLGTRAALVDAVLEQMQRFGVSMLDLTTNAKIEIPRPPHWGGFRLSIDTLELWAGTGGRVHDRAVWTYTSGAWSTPQRLMP